MTEIRFYHLTRSTLDQALPDLLEKTLARGWRAVVRLGDTAKVEPLAAHLWAYRKESFLPHGCAKDGHAAAQPVWLTAAQERPNEAQVLFVADGADAADLDAFDLLCEVIDGNDTQSVQEARTRWSAYKTAGYKLTYWQQGEKGWTKKGE